MLFIKRLIKNLTCVTLPSYLQTDFSSAMVSGPSPISAAKLASNVVSSSCWKEKSSGCSLLSHSSLKEPMWKGLVLISTYSYSGTLVLESDCCLDAAMFFNEASQARTAIGMMGNVVSGRHVTIDINMRFHKVIYQVIISCILCSVHDPVRSNDKTIWGGFITKFIMCLAYKYNTNVQQRQKSPTV